MIRVRDKNAGALLIGETDVSCVFYQGEVVWKKNSTQYVFTESGSIDIPTYAVFVDLVLVGGGASGRTGNGASGSPGIGGKAGQWVGVTLERGVELPWSTKSMMVTVGAGGTFPANHNDAGPTLGSPSAVSLAGVSSIVALGGQGHRGDGIPVKQAGEDAGDFDWEGQRYIGGKGGRSSNGWYGLAPGGGGAGGNGGFLDQKVRGWPGGRGQVWVKFRSY